MIDASQVAEEISLLMTAKTRARLSEKHLCELANCANENKLPISYVVRVRDELSMIGIAFVELERGGYGLLQAHTLEGAPPLPRKQQ